MPRKSSSSRRVRLVTNRERIRLQRAQASAVQKPENATRFTPPCGSLSTQNMGIPPWSDSPPCVCTPPSVPSPPCEAGMHLNETKGVKMKIKQNKTRNKQNDTRNEQRDTKNIQNDQYKTFLNEEKKSNTEFQTTLSDNAVDPVSLPVKTDSECSLRDSVQSNYVHGSFHQGD